MGRLKYGSRKFCVGWSGQVEASIHWFFWRERLRFGFASGVPILAVGGLDLHVFQSDLQWALADDVDLYSKFLSRDYDARGIRIADKHRPQRIRFFFWSQSRGYGKS